MAQKIAVDITINGTKISPIAGLSLHQTINEHHEFELKIDHDVVEEPTSVNLDKATGFLGKGISITIGSSDVNQVFKGVVTDVSFSNNAGTVGEVIIRGFSPTILLDGQENSISYTEKGLSQIVKDALSSVPSNILSSKVSPVRSATIPYLTQYRESNFNFVRRLAAENGEWFFYDGSALCFGKPSGQSKISLNYPSDLSELNMQVRLAPVGFEEISYLSKEHKKISGPSSSSQVEGLNTFGKSALSASQSAFAGAPSSLSQQKFLVEKDIKDFAKIRKARAAAGLVVLSGRSDHFGVKLGQIIAVTSNQVGKKSPVDFGEFTVTSVLHTFSSNGTYANIIEAIPSTIAVLPNPYLEKPLAEQQVAIVKDNKDKDNLGRVKVQMMWQKDSDTTPFIRVMMPHSGSKANDKQNTRGMFFTPEIDDLVFVGFAQNNPDRPFVLGSIPHGKSISSSSNSENHIKSLGTRSGSIITFFDKDKDKEQEIIIQTDDTNYLSINVKNGDGTVKIYSSKAVEVSSKETIVVKAGKSIEVQGDKTITVKSEKIAIEATDTVSIKANKKIELSAVDIAISASKGLEAKGGATVKIEGAQTEVGGTATAKLKGAMVGVEGSAMTTVKGAIVQIN